MSKKDKVKATLSFLQAVIICLITALFAIFGYAAIHYKDFDLVLGISVGLSVLLLVIVLCVFGTYFKKNLKKLEKMK
ncbi:hypothetical protein [Helicobacter sp. T3_23-1056]